MKHVSVASIGGADAGVIGNQARDVESVTAAIIAALQQQAQQNPGFNVETTAKSDLLAVRGILDVGALAAAILNATSR